MTNARSPLSPVSNAWGKALGWRGCSRGQGWVLQGTLGQGVLTHIKRWRASLLKMLWVPFNEQ